MSDVMLTNSLQKIAEDFSDLPDTGEAIRLAEYMRQQRHRLLVADEQRDSEFGCGFVRFTDNF